MNGRLEPIDIRYIKLGRKGTFLDEALARGKIPLGFSLADHDLCAAGRWEETQVQLIERGRGERAAKQDIRELREYYELPAGTLWIAMDRGYLWWTVAKWGIEPVSEIAVDQPSRWRDTEDGWRDTSLSGRLLELQILQSKLTKTRFYKRTICKVAAEDYLLHCING